MKAQSQAMPLEVIVWDYATQREISAWPIPWTYSNSLAVSPDGKRVAAGGSSGEKRASACIVDLATGQLDLPETEGNYVRSLAFSPDGTVLACGISLPSSTATDTMWFYDVENRREIKRVPDAHRHETFSMRSAPAGKSLVTAGYAGDLLTWDWQTLRIRSRIDFAGKKTATAITADGSLIFAGQMGPFTRDAFPPVQAWSHDSPRPILDLGKVFWGLHIIACSPDGQWLAGLSALNPNYCRLHVWSVAGRRRTRRWLGGHGDKECWGVAFATDIRTLLSSGDDHEVRTWDLGSGRQRQVLSGHGSLASCVAVDATGKYWASGDWTGKVKVWHAGDGSLVATLEGHEKSVRSVAFSPDGLRLASGGKDRRLCVWDLASRKAAFTFSDFTDHVRSVAFSPDGRWLAAGSSDESLVLLSGGPDWRLHSRVIADDKVTAVAFAPIVDAYSMPQKEARSWFAI